MSINKDNIYLHNLINYLFIYIFIDVFTLINFTSYLLDVNNFLFRILSLN